ncbi:recombination regulator RecX [Rhizobium sp. 18055]|uniref:recombination regulator RecX n=1 Tax=Rhizobium sp. 18055 TaxID=2681403 RepID=UPI00135A75E9|nr:recombination regulator RecX [Rhizobium sp. 18055]
MADEDVQSDTPTPRMQSWARNSTIYRLGRQMLTEKQLFDAISRKAKQKFEGISQAQIRALADLAVKFGYDQGGLNDVAYAEISVRSGVRSGRSKRIIAQKLSIKGVDRETAVTALEESDDLAAAIIFARKRAFGPFRRLGADEKRYAKEMSAFARNGFGFEMGRSVLGMSRDEAETLLAERQS